MIVAQSSFKYIPGYYVSEYHRYFQRKEIQVSNYVFFSFFFPFSFLHSYIRNCILLWNLIKIVDLQLEYLFMNVHGFQD